MIVVDTNTIAYLYLPCEHTAAAEALFSADPEWVAPALWKSELRNVLIGHVRLDRLTLEQAFALQEEAEDLMRGVEYAVDSPSVLRLARDSGCSAYDCEFVALAKHLGTKLATTDAKVLAAFPSIALALPRA